MLISYISILYRNDLKQIGYARVSISSLPKCIEINKIKEYIEKIQKIN